MSQLLQLSIALTPWAWGYGHAIMNAYNVNNFEVTSDGHDLLIISGAAIAVEGWAIMEFIKFYWKKRKGQIRINPEKSSYGKWMTWFWIVNLVFYIMVIALSAMNIYQVDHPDNIDLTVNDGQVGGSFGNALKGMTYANIAVGGIAFLIFSLTELHRLRKKEPKPIMVEYSGTKSNVI